MCSVKLENLTEMEKLLDAFNMPKLNQDAINNLNSPIASNETKKR